MLYKKSLRLFLAVALAASAAIAQQKAADRGAPDVERLREAINYLASDKLEGRRTGTPGAEAAAVYTPDGDNPHGRFARAGGLRFKAAAARAAGAEALVIVASEENFKDDKLTTLKYDNAGGDAGLPVVAVSRQAAAKILGLESAARLSEVEGVARFLKSPSSVFKTGTDMERLPPNALSIMTDVVRKNAPAANVVGVLEGSD